MKWPSPYLKMRVLGAVDTAPGRTKEERLKHVAEMTFVDEEGIPRRFTWRSIQTWLWCYTKLGFMSLQNKKRSDQGQLRKVSREQLVEAIDQVLPAFRDRHPRKAHLYRLCIERGLLRREHIAPNTFSRLVNELELLKPDADRQHRQAFAKQFANQMWQVDTMFGPYVQGQQTKLIAFIDDASRVLCHGEFFFQENTDTFLSAFRSALYKRGIPEQIYADHGAIYTCKELLLVCSRLGIILSHAPVRDGAAKGKIERFFRNCREAFLARQLDLSSLHHLNQVFIAWVEDEYNNHLHSTLQMKPIDRFGLDLKRIRFLAIGEATDELFFIEEDRLIRADNTFSLKNIRFEPPVYLHNRKVQIRFDRKNFSSDRAIVYYKGQRLGPARPVDFTANDRAPHVTHPTPTNPNLPTKESCS
jgi:transposase InsO family protein